MIVVKVKLEYTQYSNLINAASVAKGYLCAGSVVAKEIGEKLAKALDDVQVKVDYEETRK